MGAAWAGPDRLFRDPLGRDRDRRLSARSCSWP